MKSRCFNGYLVGVTNKNFKYDDIYKQYFFTYYDTFYIRYEVTKKEYEHVELYSPIKHIDTVNIKWTTNKYAGKRNTNKTANIKLNYSVYDELERLIDIPKFIKPSKFEGLLLDNFIRKGIKIPGKVLTPEEETLYSNSFKRRLLELAKVSKDRYIHLSNDPIIDLKNNMQLGSWTQPPYENPFGLWFSCGNQWAKQYDQWAKRPYVYECFMPENVLYIKNVKEFKTFCSRFGPKIDWKKVKKEYDGLVICKYLMPAIDGSDNSLHINNDIMEYLKKKKIELPYEWYRHWETGTGVVWRNASIKLLEVSHWHKEILDFIKYYQK
jgi:hypothetical protein